jgi:hypothetical protein
MASKENPLIRVGQLGQSIWLDFLRRGMLESGELMETLDAYRDHGQPAVRLEEDLDDARQVLDSLKQD